jgi:hypothetical protein
MIETNFFILTHDQYHQFNSEASELGLSVDYFLMEFCTVEGEWVTVE